MGNSNLKKRISNAEEKTGAKKDITVVFYVTGHDGKIINSLPVKMNFKEKVKKINKSNGQGNNCH